MKILICETYSYSRKDYVALPDKYDIELCFLKENGQSYLKVSFFDENDDELFHSAVYVSGEFEDVAESIRKYPRGNVVLSSMLEKITTDFQETLTSSVGNVVVFDLDKFLDPWYDYLNEQLADYCKKHFK